MNCRRTISLTVAVLAASIGCRNAPAGEGPYADKLAEYAPMIERLKGGEVSEVIVATNPTTEGDATAFYIQKALAASGVQVTRIARGIPAGSTLEYSDRTVVGDALSERREF